jgi:hypothetical protein
MALLTTAIKVGDIFDNWIVLSDTLVYRSGKYYVFCKCTACNITEKYVQVIKLESLKTKICSDCNSKLGHKFEKIHSEESRKESRYFTTIKSRAKKKIFEFNLTQEYIFELLKKQKFKCALSGLDINFYNSQSTTTASLDRKDSTKGYIEGNVQWVNKDINRMKNEFSEEYFLSLCKNIVEHKSTKNIFND